MNSYIHKESNRGFTIIELLIVIVIIGVLVAITAVSYTGITRSANEAAVKSDLKQAKTALELNKAKTGIYPASLDTNNPPVNQPKSAVLAYTQFSDGQGYVLVGESRSNPDIIFIIRPNEGITKAVASPDIQTITRSSCSTERVQVKDARDNHSYYVKKLADGNCWMLTNLAYAGGVSNGGSNAYGDVINQGGGVPGSGTINDGTEDEEITFTLAKFYIPPGANVTVDPAPPSTAVDGGVEAATRQVGYHYNWCAAMGAQNTAACTDAATTPAPNPSINICPSGWRLPTGQPTTGEFTALNTAINNGSASSDAGLLASGLFQRSGWTGMSFWGIGINGNYWSSTQSSATYAYHLYLHNTLSDPSYSYDKNSGQAIRCIAE